ncbi:MAG: DNA adenine methylase [Bryobacterales bacterium]|nr:DNA adenine methylase [Bryobacterales bacterium]
MSVNISYMGTKKVLAPAVIDVVASAQSGILLDAFSGMCSVGEAVAPKRQVWANDIQVFSYEVAAALFTSADGPQRPVRVADLHFESFTSHKVLLTHQFTKSLEAEALLLQSKDFTEFSDRYVQFKNALDSDLSRFRRHDYVLFSTLYPDTFFGIRQAIEIDAITASIQLAFDNRRATTDDRRWLLVGLGRAMLRISNSTGHFAQFLKPNPKSYQTFLRQRRREVWREWLSAADEMDAVGGRGWREGNRCFNEDCLALLPRLPVLSERPSVIYADPPYTDDQYSRYYHLLETLVLYDYPTLTGAGRYREQRFRTPFSVKSQAPAALHELVRSAANTGADLVLTYPTNGLMYESGGDLKVLIQKYFRKVEVSQPLEYHHSTFGASKGPVKTTVKEQIYLGRQ